MKLEKYRTLPAISRIELLMTIGNEPRGDVGDEVGGRGDCKTPHPDPGTALLGAFGRAQADGILRNRKFDATSWSVHPSLLTYRQVYCEGLKNELD